MQQNFKSANLSQRFFLAFTAIVSVSAWSGTSQAQVASGNSYRIISACGAGDKVLSIAGASTADGTAVVLATKNNSQASQIFKFESAGGAYAIRAQVSNKVFGILGASTKLNAPLQQFTSNGQANQLFTVQSAPNGFYRLQNVNSQLYINLAKASAVDGNIFEQYSNNGSCAQLYKFSLVATAVPPRNPLKQPFSSGSIWNMPIGSAAVYVAANLPIDPGGDPWAPMPMIDDEPIILKPTSPLVDINYSNAGWTGKNRCAATGGLLVKAPIPTDYLLPNSNANASAAILMADGRTIVQVQPLTRCTAGGSATSIVKFANVDLYGDGITGAHGGSGLSAIGGSIRVGELRPGSQGPRHALKIIVYAKQSLYRCTTRSDCFRWPATTADSYAVGMYGTASNNMNTAMKMGALLAIPASTNIANLGLETEPGRQMAWTLQNYGGYIVDDGYGPQFGFAAEGGPDGSVRTQFKADYGFDLATRVNGNTAWMRDVQRLAQALYVVNNNSATSIGGGGTPRQPLAPPITP